MIHGSPSPDPRVYGARRRSPCRRLNIHNEQTGKTHSASAISATSPDFMRSPIMHNPSVYEERGLILRPDPVNPKDVTLQRHFRPSYRSPRWFQQQYLDNEEYIKSIETVHGMNERPEIEHSYKAMFSRSTGLPSASCSMPSSSVPDWMRGPMDSNRKYYVDNGLLTEAEIARILDQEDKSAESALNIHIVNEETGKIATQFITSKDSPTWMKLPLKCNREYFDRKGLIDQLKLMRSKSAPHGGIRRRIHKNHLVSPTTPRWMRDPLSNNLSDADLRSFPRSTSPERNRGLLRTPEGQRNSPEVPQWMKLEALPESYSQQGMSSPVSPDAEERPGSPARSPRKQKVPLTTITPRRARSVPSLLDPGDPALPRAGGDTKRLPASPVRTGRQQIDAKSRSSNSPGRRTSLQGRTYSGIHADKIAALSFTPSSRSSTC